MSLVHVPTGNARKPPIHERSQPPPCHPRPNIETVMPTKAFPFLAPANIGSDLPNKLRALADDLERMLSGGFPTDAELKGAPILSDWTPVLSLLGLRFAGVVAGHPRLGNSYAVTSQLWAADPSGHWVRTLSRLYRLGSALPDGLIQGEDPDRERGPK